MKAMEKPRATVFLLGYPRSGTTWISNLINAHPDVVYRHELFGRCHALFGSRLFSALKYDNGVSDEDYATALRIAVLAHPEADRPPFFGKTHSMPGLGWARKPAWLLGKSNRYLGAAYARAYAPRKLGRTTLVVKETRSSVNLDSLVNGLRANKILILVRHPYSVIASHLSGRSAGVMAGDGPERRAEWFSHNKDANYITRNEINLAAIQQMSYVEYLAINWLLQNLDYMKMVDRNEATVFSYENFLSHPETETRKLYSELDLDVTQQVQQFLAETTTSADVSVFKKDASNEFYSVFRGKSFDPAKWKKSLTAEDVALIDRHCEDFIQELGVFETSDFRL